MHVWLKYDELKQKYYDICNNFCLLFKEGKEFFGVTEMTAMIDELISDLKILIKHITNMGKLANDEEQKVSTTKLIYSHLKIKLDNINNPHHIFEYKESHNDIDIISNIPFEPKTIDSNVCQPNIKSKYVR